MKKAIAFLMAMMMTVSLAACGSSEKEDAPASKKDAAAETTESDASGEVYEIGICQLVQHEALDAATLGFKEALIELLGEENVKFDEQNASGDSATCSTIINQFVSNEVDLILANATAALQAAAAGTNSAPG